MPEPIIIKFQTDLTQVESAIDALEQLGAVDKKTADEFRKTAATVKAHNDELAKTGKNADAVTVDVQEMVKAIKDIPKNIISDSAKKSLEDGGKAADQMATKSQRLTTQLRAMKQELSQMEQAGLQNTKQYQRMAAEAGKLEDQIGDTAQRVKILASDTKNLDAALSLATGVAGGFSVAQGAAALFGSENEDLQKTLLKVQGALAILNGLQAIQATLNKDSAASVVLLGGAQKLYTTYIGASTGAVRLFKIALAGLGIGLAVFAIIEGVKALGDWITKMNESVKVVDGATLSYETYQDLQKRTTDGYIQEKIRLDQLLAVARNNNLALDDRQKAVSEINKLSPKYLGNLTLATIEQGKETTAVNAYIETLMRKAKAQALEEILVEKNKELYEAQNKSLYDGVTLLGQAWDVVKAIFSSDPAQPLRDRAQDNRDAVSGLTSEIAELEKALTEVNVQIIQAGDDLAIYQSTATQTAQVVRDVWQGLTAVSVIPVPDELEGDAEEAAIVVRDFYQSLQDYSDATKEKALSDLMEIYAGWVSTYEKAKEIAMASFDTIGQASDVFLNNELVNLDEQLANKQISQEQYDKKVAEAKRKEAEREKALNFFKSLIQIPSAFLKGLTDGGLPLAILYSALATIQSGLILAEKIPAFAAGEDWVEGGTPGKDSVHALLMPGERVVTAGVNEDYYPILQAIHERALPADFLNSIAAGMIPVGAGGGFTLDYDLLADKLGEKISSLPISQFFFDENGFTRSVANGGNRTTYLNSRYRN